MNRENFKRQIEEYMQKTGESQLGNAELDKVTVDMAVSMHELVDAEKTIAVLMNQLIESMGSLTMQVANLQYEVKDLKKGLKDKNANLEGIKEDMDKVVECTRECGPGQRYWGR